MYSIIRVLKMGENKELTGCDYASCFYFYQDRTNRQQVFRALPGAVLLFMYPIIRLKWNVNIAGINASGRAGKTIGECRNSSERRKC